MHIKKVGLFILTFAAALPMQAQKLTLSLNEARNYALEHNRTMINAGLTVDKARMAVWEAIAHGLPQVDASMDYSNALGAQISIRFREDMPPTKIDIEPQSNLFLNVGQLLFSGNYIVGIQTARLYHELSKLNKEKTELDVIAMTTDAYYLVLISNEMKSVLEKNLSNLRELYAKTSVLEYAGLIEKTDLDLLWVQVNTLQNALNASERQVELTTNMLRLQLGVSVDTEIELTETLPELIADAKLENVLLQQFQPDNNINLRLMEQQTAIGEKLLDMRRAGALPTLSAFYRFTHKILRPDFDMAPTNMLGLQMNIPLFSSGLRHAQTQQAYIDLKSIRNNYLLVNDQLQIQESQLRFNFANALESYENQSSSVEVSRRVNESIRRKYAQGMISGLDIVTADNNFLRAETDYISAMMQVLTARLQLEKLYGNIK